VAKYYCGIDFGTTNSSAALANDAGQVRVLALDAMNDSPTSLPSLLYIARDGERIIGRGAANAFIERNVDREVILEKIDLGISIEGYVGGEPDKSEGYRPREDGADIREAVKAQALVEVNSPGRLFQSLKSSLRISGYHGTEIFGQHYQIEELTAMILRRIKKRVDEAAGESVDTAVFGRPVRFSIREREDQVAERRLRTAAHLAGFTDVIFFYEPVAACVEYAIATEHRQRLMVVDIGGGTCDVCVMEFGGAEGTAERLEESRILGVAGLPIAGDAIDREITRTKVFPCLGSRSRYGPSQLPVPQYLYTSVADWQNLYKLNTEETINWLIAMEGSSTQPEAIRALRGLIRRNLGYPLAREVEAAKKRLSTETRTAIQLDRDHVHIHQPIDREELTDSIHHVLDRMRTTIEEAEIAAQLRPGDIDCVLTTGGTSLVPPIRHMLEQRFGADKMLQRDTFTSVAAGLAVVARYI
jgi:hypothetical chaperone protein